MELSEKDKVRRSNKYVAIFQQKSRWTADQEGGGGLVINHNKCFKRALQWQFNNITINQRGELFRPTSSITAFIPLLLFLFI